MALMPKRVKFRKSQKGRVRGNATRGNYVAFGEYGLQALESGRISAQTIEAGRVVASQSVKGGGKLFIRVSAGIAVTLLCGKIRMYTLPPPLTAWLATTRPASMVCAEIRPPSRVCKPNSPNDT